MSVPNQPASVTQHRQAARKSLSVVVVTISDTRSLADDTSGQLIVDSLVAAGHRVIERVIVPDELELIRQVVVQRTKSASELDVMLLTGGTGISPRDKTPEAIEPLIEQSLPGFGELFRMLSFAEIGAAAMLSRAMAGRIGQVLVFCLPGSTAAVRLAMDKLLVPELPHLVHHARA
jgi:molybdopterin adenylyltransferase